MMFNHHIRPPLHLTDRFEGLTRARLLHILDSVSRLKVGVIGDGCVDIYWHADMAISELSRETPHHPLPVVKETFSPGAAGNVAANLKALGCAEVLFCSVRGDDWRGTLLEHCLNELGIDESLMTVEPERVTPAYCKPLRYGRQGAWQEDPRIDFANRLPLTETAEERLLQKLDEMAVLVDAIAVTDQFTCGVITTKVRERLRYWAERGKVIGVDSRDRIGLFKGVILKPNEMEAIQAVDGQSTISGSDAHAEWVAWLQAGERLRAKSGAPCCITLGDNGSLWLQEGKPVWVPSLSVQPPLDIVGAGDCFMASLISALGAGYPGPEAMAFAHLSASVVIKKLGTTGTSTPHEIVARFADSGSPAS